MQQQTGPEATGLPGFRYVCDTEGFYQHYSECWLDAFTMIFLFADGIKELTQPAIYNTPIEDVDLSRIEAVEPALVPQIKGFILNLRERFIRHYWNQIVREKTELPPELAKRGEGRQACRMAITGRGILKPDPSKRAVLTMENYRARFKGGSMTDVIEIMHTLIRLYKLRSLQYRLAITVPNPALLPSGGELMDPKHYTSPAPTDVAFWFAVRKREKSAGHTVAFYTCGGNQYIYENERGPMPFAWRTLLTWIAENPSEKEMRLGFIDSAAIPMECVDVAYYFYPIAYKHIIHPETGATHLRYAILCMNGAIRTGTMQVSMVEYLYEVIGLIKYISDIPTGYVEPPLAYTPRYYPRKQTKKVTVTATRPTNATGQRGSSRRHHRSKHRTRKH